MGAGRKKSMHPTVKCTIIINIINLGIDVARRIIAVLTHTYRHHKSFQHVNVIYINYLEYRLTKVASSAAVQPKQVIAFGCVNLLVCCTTNQLSNLFLTKKWLSLHYFELTAMQIRVQRLSEMHVVLTLTKPDLYISVLKKQKANLTVFKERNNNLQI